MKDKLNRRKSIIIGILILVIIAATTVIITLSLINNTNDKANLKSKASVGNANPITITATSAPTDSDKNPKVVNDNHTINVYTCDRNFRSVIKTFLMQHTGFKKKINSWDDSISLSSTDIMNIADKALKSGDSSEMDIYVVPMNYMEKYIKGEFAQYACTYKELGIDVDSELAKAQLPQYVIDEGSNPDGEIIALPYSSTPNMFMYRRSIAKKVWGTDDPEQIGNIIGAGSGSFDQLLKAAQVLKKHGYYVVPGCDDLWTLVDTTLSSVDPVNDINPEWEKFMDMSKTLYKEGCIGDTHSWTEQWYKDLDGKGAKPVFGYFITPDVISYFSGSTRDEFVYSRGDWAICMPPIKSRVIDYTTGILVNKYTTDKEEIGQLIEWLTLDTSDQGYQYYCSTKEKRPVISGTVLKNTKCCLDLLGGQDMNPLIDQAVNNAVVVHDMFSSKGLFAQFWLDAVRAYSSGQKDKVTAISEYKDKVKDIDITNH